MERYQQGRIYAIRSNETDEIYIGSTCLTLPKRLYKHRESMKRYKEGKMHYKSSYKILEHADHYIELIELYPCNSKEELCRREGEIMREHVNRVNKQLAGRTKAEYRADNKEQRAITDKEWYEKNKASILQKQKNKIVCECGSEITQSSKSYHIKSKKHKAYVATL